MARMRQVELTSRRHSQNGFSLHNPNKRVHERVELFAESIRSPLAVSSCRWSEKLLQNVRFAECGFMRARTF